MSSHDFDNRVGSFEELASEREAELAAAARQLQNRRLDQSRCTYSDGYKRQDIYVCLSCFPQHPVALCYGCMMTCHADCDQIEELEHRNHIRCDCGTQPATAANSNADCKYANDATTPTQAEKAQITNTENRYNHNYIGHFCHCNTRYNPSTETIGEMLQCCLCSDWFHSPDHLTLPPGVSVPDEEDDSELELVCKNCTNDAHKQFLLPYIAHAHHNVVNGLNPSTTPQQTQCRRIRELPSGTTTDQLHQYDQLVNFNWSSLLCECSECKPLYETADVMSLFYNDDDATAGTNGTNDSMSDGGATVSAAHDDVERALSGRLDDQLASMLQQLPHAQAARLVEGFNAYKAAIRRGLDQFAEENPGGIVTPDIIQHIMRQAASEASTESMMNEQNPELMEMPE